MTTETGESQRLTAPKNEERIREIRTNTSVDITATIRSPQIRRWMMREFYFVTSQLFLLTNTSKARRIDTRALAKLMQELEFATELLVMDTEFYKARSTRKCSSRRRTCGTSFPAKRPSFSSN
jgi:hypothetical protein